MTDPARLWSARLPLSVGFAAVALLLGGLGAWSVGTEIAGAVVARGVVQVEAQRQVIQHPDGGVVGEILARDGDVVAAGDVLLRLDGTFLRSELSIIERKLAEIHVRRARLEAERDAAERPDFGGIPEFMLIDAAAIADQIAGQEALFEARRTSLSQERSQIAEQQVQIAAQIDGAEAQRAAADRQLTLVTAELADVERLFARGLVQAARVSDLRREAARLEGEIGRLDAVAAEARTRIAGLDIESLRIADRRREDAIAELRDLQFSEFELEERRISLIERLSRLDLRAPVDGTVLGSRVSAVQAVVQAAEPMMFLVPGSGPLQVSVRIAPEDIDQVRAGQPATLLLTAFSRRTTPEIPGTVLRVAADAQADPQTGRALLRGGRRARSGRPRGARRPDAAARHAGRGLPDDRGAHAPRLSRAAADRLLLARLPGGMTGRALPPTDRATARQTARFSGNRSQRPLGRARESCPSSRPGATLHPAGRLGFRLTSSRGPGPRDATFRVRSPAGTRRGKIPGEHCTGPAGLSAFRPGRAPALLGRDAVTGGHP
jgi:HlyD family type I secretion membrane fusion protein